MTYFFYSVTLIRQFSSHLPAARCPHMWTKYPLMLMYDIISHKACCFNKVGARAIEICLTVLVISQDNLPVIYMDTYIACIYISLHIFLTMCLYISNHIDPQGMLEYTVTSLNTRNYLTPDIGLLITSDAVAKWMEKVKITANKKDSTVQGYLQK